MSTTKQATSETTTNTSGRVFLFSKENYTLMFVGLAVIILGFILMAGGKSSNPNVFNEAEIYSAVRISVAPILVLLGLAIEGYAIMKKPKS
jgi:uncharacterized membrane protein